MSRDGYWTVDIVGLSEDEAKRVSTWAKVEGLGAGWGGDVIDPRRWYQGNWDITTVQMVVSALRQVPAPNPAASILEDLENWLESAEPLVRCPCPCCGFLTFFGDPPDDADDPNAWCPVCGWISDFVQNNHPKASGMPNMFSLEDSRANFAEHGAAIPGDDRVRPPRGEELPS